MVREKYQVELHYGYQETDCGIFHSFMATDPEKHADVTEMGATGSQWDIGTIKTPPKNSGAWSWGPDSNRRPTHYECVALPTELHQHIRQKSLFFVK